MPGHAETPREPRITVRSKTPRQGSLVVLSLNGLRPREHLIVRAARAQATDGVTHDIRVDADGRIDTALRLPVIDDKRQRWTFAATSAERDLQVSTAPVDVLPGC